MLRSRLRATFLSNRAYYMTKNIIILKPINYVNNYLKKQPKLFDQNTGIQYLMQKFTTNKA